MHLNECYAHAMMANSGQTVSDMPFHEVITRVDIMRTCISTWMFKTTTSFNGMHDELNLPWWFGVCCFNFSILGCTMLLTKPRWTKHSRFPYVTFALILMFVQGPLSFLADYMHGADNSIFHAVDRLLACPLMLLALGRVFTWYPHIRRATFSFYAVATFIAVYSFIKSQQAQSQIDIGSFIFWHNMWHMFPLACSVIMAIDYYVLGEYDAAERSKGYHPTSSKNVGNGTTTMSAALIEQGSTVVSSPRGNATRRARARIADLK